jgi:parallel beta-helix repeat protein
LSDAAHGIAVFGNSAPAVSDVTIQNCTSTPVYESISAKAVYTNILFIANAITAVGLRGETIALDSRLAVRNLGGYSNITYYVMNGTITMNSPAVLRIDPGVVVKNQMFSGGFIIHGAMVADGKADSLIVFTSERDDLYGNPADTNGDGSTTTPAVNNWTYIQFTATSDDVVSVMDYCRITYGSYDPGNSWPCLLWYTSAASPVTNCFLSHGSYGIRADGNAAPLIDMNEIRNCTSAPIVMSVQASPDITVSNAYAANGYNALALISETLSQNATIRYRPGVGSPTFAYLPTGTITVASGVTLAIEPQVVLKPTSSFNVFNVNGALNIVGSNATTGRVVFTSRRDDNALYGGDTTPNDASTPQAGDWGSIQFNDQSVDAACIVRNCLFQFGAGGGQDQGVLTTVSASPRFVGNEFFQNVTAMTFKGTSQPTVDTTAVLNCTQLPIVWSLVSDPQFPNPGEITLANNMYTALGILGESVAQDVTTRVRGLGSIDNMPYVPTTTITIAFGAEWTIRPGVVIKLGRYVSDPTGITIVIDGALIADGKPDSLIVFTSMADDAFGGDTMGDGAATSPAPSQWQALQFGSVSDDAATVVDHCRFRYGGLSSWGHLRFTNAGPTISNTYSTGSGSYGTLIEGASSPTFNDCFFDSGGNVPVQMSLVSTPTFNNVQFLGNTYTALGVINESIAQDVLWPIRAVSGRNNMPYLLQAQLTTGLGATVTMQPGVMVKSTGSGSIRVQRAFIAEGRSQPESLIVFTSYRDDFYGGDTNNDGATTVPAASDWNYVWVDGTAIDPDVRFKNVVFRYGGSGSTQGALRCVNSSPSVDSCLIANNTVGISVEGASNPTVNGCSIYGNTQFGINNTGNSFCIDAENNWWGAVSGPNDASAAADLCLLGANAGTGDKVSNNVDYDPWSVGGVQTALLGDVSLNGQVLAYDASLVLQAVALIIVLSPLQQLVADVSGTAGITAFDASLILQYVAGSIPAFPAASSKPGELSPDVLAAQQVVESAKGEFQVELGEAVRDGGTWRMPVRLSGNALAYSAELSLEGEVASRLLGVEMAPQGTLVEHGVRDGAARVVMAATSAMPMGEVLVLRFAAGAESEFTPPALAWARVNENEAGRAPAPAGPALSFLAPPAPNPARSSVSLTLGISAEDAGSPVRIVLYDIAGRAVRVLQDGTLPAGLSELRWDLTRGDGTRLPAGIYFVHARTRSVEATHRIVVVR